MISRTAILRRANLRRAGRDGALLDGRAAAGAASSETAPRPDTPSAPRTGPDDSPPGVRLHPSLKSAVRLRQLQSDSVALLHLKVAHPQAPSGALYGSAAKVAANARQATLYEDSAAAADIGIRPLLLYYSYLHWMKTVLYASDLSYPQGSSLLQHGLSVRRVKRDVYRWPLDFAYVYKEGVLQSFRDLADPELTLPNKIPLGHLLGSIPFAAEAVGAFYPEFQHMYRLLPDGLVARRIASNIGLTPAEWLDAYLHADLVGHSGWGDGAPARGPAPAPPARVRAGSAALPGQPSGPAKAAEGRANGGGRDRDPADSLRLPVTSSSHPWVHHVPGGTWIGDGHAYPLWVSDVVTMYVLSTLCRYNAVEWLDIVHWNNDKDAHLVREYLATAPPFPELMETLGQLERF